MDMANMVKKKWAVGERVKVSGPVRWGEDEYRVVSGAEVVEWKRGAYALLLIDTVDGDSSVCTHVRKNCIYPPED